MHKYRIDLNDCVALIFDKEIKEFIEYALSKVDKKFYEVPASSSGKYHCKESNISPGGLIVHIRRSFIYALHLIRFYDGRHTVSKDTRDIILAGILLHDCYKGMENGVWIDKTNFNHGPLGAEWLRKIYKEKYKKENRKIDRICHLVKTHMARWNPEPTPPKDGEYDEHIVCIADYLGSMRNLSMSASTINEIMDF